MPVVYNSDIEFLHKKISRAIVELSHSQSASTSQMIAPDQTRLQSYLEALKTAKSWVIGQPILDLPETHPLQIDLEEVDALPAIENDAIVNAIRLLSALDIELVNSQSARNSSGLNVHDAKRFDDIVTKAELFLTGYIAVATPIDEPESSPMRAMTPSGRRGTAGK
jgi:hypothetical protein